jgi:CheY-like chemotaxis protein
MTSKPFTILLIENDQDHAEIIKRSLAHHIIHNTICHLKDGEKALTYINQKIDYQDAEKNPIPHLILLDLRLPKVDGLEVLKQIKTSETLRKIPVIILTSSESEKDMEKAYEYYVNSYLVKPIGYEKFNNLLNDMLAYWFSWNYNIL